MKWGSNGRNKPPGNRRIVWRNPNPDIVDNPEVGPTDGRPRAKFQESGVSVPLPASGLRTPSKGKLTPFFSRYRKIRPFAISEHLSDMATARGKWILPGSRQSDWNHAGQPSGLISLEVLNGASAGLPRGQNRDYSQRSAVTGSTRVARYAGMQV